MTDKTAKLYSLPAFAHGLRKEGMSPTEAARFSRNIATEMAADGDLVNERSVGTVAAPPPAPARAPAREDGWVGPKYDSAMDITEIAKRVRADVKTAHPGVKVSVRTHRFAGGRSLDLKVTGVPKGFRIMNPQHVVFEAENPHACFPRNLPRHTAAATDLLSALTAIVNAYRFDKSDIQTDYWNNNFYEHVSFAGSLEEAERQAIREELAS